MADPYLPDAAAPTWNYQTRILCVLFINCHNPLNLMGNDDSHCGPRIFAVRLWPTATRNGQLPRLSSSDIPAAATEKLVKKLHFRCSDSACSKDNSREKGRWSAESLLFRIGGFSAEPCQEPRVNSERSLFSGLTWASVKSRRPPPHNRHLERIVNRRRTPRSSPPA